MKSLKNLTKLVVSSFGLYFGCHTIDRLEVNGLAGNIMKMHDVKYVNQYDLMGQILDKVKAERPGLRGRATVLIGDEHLEDIPMTGDKGQLSVTLVLNPNQLEFKVLRGNNQSLFVKYERLYQRLAIRTNQILDPTKTYSMQEVLAMEAYIALQEITPCFEWVFRDLGLLPENPVGERDEEVIETIKAGARRFLL